MAKAKKGRAAAGSVVEDRVLPIAEILVADRYQVRCQVYPDTVSQYEQLLRDASVAAAEGDGPDWPFEGRNDGRLLIGRIGGKLYVLDGFHRLEAARRAGLLSVPCRVHRVTDAQAFVLAARANTGYARQLTIKDKRRMVVLAIGRHPGWSSRRVAEELQCSHTFVTQVLADLKGVEASEIEPEEVAEAVISGRARKQRQQRERQARERARSVAATQDEGGNVATDFSPGPAGDRNGAAKPTTAKQTAAKPTTVGGVRVEPVDLRSEKLAELSKIFGQLVRGMRDLGMYDEVEGEMRVLSNWIGENRDQRREQLRRRGAASV